MYEFIVSAEHITAPPHSKVMSFAASQFVTKDVKDWLREYRIRYDIVGGGIDERKGRFIPIRVMIYDETHALMFRLAFGMPCEKLDALYV